MNIIINTYLSIAGGLQSLKLKRASRSPIFAAESTLRRILSISKNTVYGREHHFAEILAAPTATELFTLYRHFVPTNDYEVLRPYVERHKAGEQDILFPGKPKMYATTSGTTSKPKWVPMTHRYLHDVYGSMSRLWTWNFVKHRHNVFSGHVLQIVGKDCEGYAPDGTVYGSVSGVLVRDIPWILRRLYTAPASAMAISDYHVRNYVVMLLALQYADLSFWATANPSTILELLHTVDDHYDEMVSDIERGTISVDVDEPLRPEIERYMHANPRRAAELRQLKEFYGHPLPKHYWPNLQVLSSWKCGNTKVYMDKYLDAFDFTKTYYQELGYIATECRFGFALDDSNESVLFPHFHYYEFVDEREMDSPQKHFLQINELEFGRRYCAYVTTYSGLYRYNMNDLIEVGGEYYNTPTIHMVSKVNGIVSMTGEKLYEPQFIQAVHEAEAETSTLLRFFVGFANVQESAYDFYFEFADETITQAEADMFALVVDKHLQNINMEYESKRASFRLHEPVAHLLYSNAYSRFKARCLKDGFRDGQFKFNLLMQDERRQLIFQDLVIMETAERAARQSKRQTRRTARRARRLARRADKANRKAQKNSRKTDFIPHHKPIIQE